MKLTVMQSVSAWSHRGKTFKTRYVLVSERVKEQSIIIAELHKGRWWIIPGTTIGEAKIEDVGPFPTYEAAYATLVLIKD